MSMRFRNYEIPMATPSPMTPAERIYLKEVQNNIEAAIEGGFSEDLARLASIKTTATRWGLKEEYLTHLLDKFGE